MLRKVIDAEPELLLPYVLGRMGSTQRLARANIARDVAEGQVDGSIRAGDPRVIAHALLLTAQSFVLSGDTAEDIAPGALFDELERLVDAALRPR